MAPRSRIRSRRRGASSYATRADGQFRNETARYLQLNLDARSSSARRASTPDSASSTCSTPARTRSGTPVRSGQHGALSVALQSPPAARVPADAGVQVLARRVQGCQARTSARLPPPALAPNDPAARTFGRSHASDRRDWRRCHSSCCLRGHRRTHSKPHDRRPTSIAASHWRYIGPEGNRISAVAGVPGEPLVYYAGSASGGIHKTTDGGVTWEPIFDGQPVHSIGDIAVAAVRSEHGLGGDRRRLHPQPHLGRRRASSSPPTPARRGRGWASSRPAASATSSSIRQNPDVVLACALGHAYGPQQERGVFRTTDGGKNWERVLFVDENTGCSDLDMDPTNPRMLFAGMWQFDIKTWGRESGGPGSGLFMSQRRRHDVDAAARAAACPRATSARSTSHSRRRTPIASTRMIETGDGIPWKGKETDRGQVWRSEDGGETWRAGQLRPQRHGPHALLLAHLRRARQRERNVLPDRSLQRSRSTAAQTLVQQPGARHRAAITTTCGSIPPTPTG